jgi:hypothetical protein
LQFGEIFRRKGIEGLLKGGDAKGHKKRAANVTVFQEGKEVICGIVVGPPLAPTFLSAAQKSVY